MSMPRRKTEWMAGENENDLSHHRFLLYDQLCILASEVRTPGGQDATPLVEHANIPSPALGRDEEAWTNAPMEARSWHRE